MDVSSKRLALVAHDACKPLLVQWVRQHAEQLVDHQLVCTGTTGRLVHEALAEALPHKADTLKVERLKSGPLGGDQQLGARIADGLVDILFFFWDSMSAQPHDVDVKALLRIANLYNLPTACNMATADCIISSPLFNGPRPEIPHAAFLYADRQL